jgi:hypothetical protein
MTAPHLHLVTHTEQLRQNEALYIGGLEAANATLAEELAQALESNEDILKHYAAAMERLKQEMGARERAERWLRRRVVELAWPSILAGITAALAAVFLLRIMGV